MCVLYKEKYVAFICYTNELFDDYIIISFILILTHLIYLNLKLKLGIFLIKLITVLTTI